ncbi:MAG: hypothetical protein U5L45_18085 [Saprospiraceae bacterium]|nr:hypothetical protein [Saprospiraceae bacterium]
MQALRYDRNESVCDVRAHRPVPGLRSARKPSSRHASTRPRSSSKSRGRRASANEPFGRVALVAGLEPGLTPLLHACIVGDGAAAKDIVDKSDFMKDLDLEATASHGPHEGKTALILAAQHGHKLIVELL